VERGEGVEAVVVGAGVVGLAVARALRERGRSVVVLEREAVGAGASGVQPGGVRQQWGTRVACRLARESVDFWRAATERLTSVVPLELQTCGYLFVAHGTETLNRLAANVALQNEESVASRLVTPVEAAELAPGLRADELVGGAWCAEDGYFDRPQSVVEAFAAGTAVRIEEVVALERLRRGWRTRTSAGSKIHSDHIVVAAAVESAALVAPLGMDLPLVAEERFIFLSEPLEERLLEPLVVSAELAFAVKQLANGRVLASDLSARGDPDDGRERWRARIRGAVERLVPVLSYVSYPVLVRGVYDVTPDHQPVLGPIGGLPGLHLATGFSGHGFMIAPAVARVIADAIDGRRDEALDVLGPERFAAGRLVPEPQLV
jgi:sarcosine oxidase subunit beta